MNSFLKLFARDLIDKGIRFEELTIIFPNKRAGLFFAKELSHIIDKPVWMPQTTTLGEFIEQHTGVKQPDELTLIVKLYKAYREVSATTESFDDFYFLGNMLLKDFDDIDKYMVNAKDLFSNLTALHEIEDAFNYLTPEQIEIIKEFRQSFKGSHYSKEQEEFLKIWDNLYPTYQLFKKRLLSEKLCYEGMGQRLFCEKLSSINMSNQTVFAGFNALTLCEKKIFSHFRDNGKALFYWDYDQYYTTTGYHEAGLFIGENLKLFRNEIGAEHFNNFRYSDKHIDYISVSSSIGQAKLLPTLLQELDVVTVREFADTAVILCDEKLLTSVIYSIPEEISKINVTMGMPAQNTTVATLIAMIGELYKYAKIGKGKTYYYYKPVIAILSHKLIKGGISKEVDGLISNIHSGNIVYINENRLHLDELTTAIFNVGEFDPFTYISDIMERIFRVMANESDGNIRIEKEALFTIHNRIRLLRSMFKEEGIYPEKKAAMQIITRIIASITIPFSGEPIEGMQIMGLMESRMLDFKNIIMLSVNEGIIPGSSHDSSFIPYNLRVGFRLPTPEHRDALYAYNFYRLLQRAKNVKLLYSDITNGMSGSEMSRFLFQMQYESGLPIRQQIFQNEFTLRDRAPIIIPKNNDIMQILERYMVPLSRDISPPGDISISGTISTSGAISPSALNTYIDCKLKFYFRYIAKIREKEELTEEPDHRELGNIFHKSMQTLYAQMPRGIVTVEQLETLLKNDIIIEQHVQKAFSEIYNNTLSQALEGGNNELVPAVVKKYIRKVLEYDKEIAPFVIISMEKGYNMPFPITIDGEERVINIGGSIDRVDKSKEGIRVIDYKTGADKTTMKSLASIVDSENRQRNNAAFQTLLYCMLYEYKNPGADPVMPGIYSTKELFRQGFNHKLIIDKEEVSRFKPYEKEFRELLEGVLIELYSEDVPFDQTTVIDRCRYCCYRTICHR